MNVSSINGGAYRDCALNCCFSSCKLYLMDGDNYSRGMASDEQMGPRTVVIQRGESTDFGFTLRHFIVYPPQINQPVERGLVGVS